MLKPGAADENAAVVFDDLASALDAGLPLETLGGNPALGDHVLLDLCGRRGVRLRPTEQVVLEAGWRSGNAAATLRGRAANRRRRAEFLRDMWGAVRYPLILFLMIAVASVATMQVVGPGVMITIGVVYVVLAAMLFQVARMLGRGDASVERLPVVGKLVEDLRELPYLETLHALYGAGVPIVDAHQAAVRAVRFAGLRDRLSIAQRKLADGHPLEEALKESASLSHETRQLLSTGERAGQLEDALHRALIRRQDVATRRLTAAARRVGQVAYALAVVGVVIIVYLFYSSYFRLAMGRM